LLRKDFLKNRRDFENLRIIEVASGATVFRRFNSLPTISNTLTMLRYMYFIKANYHCENLAYPVASSEYVMTKSLGSLS